MIPTFPEFKHLKWSDREAVQKFTLCFPPYSDFNFVSMWTWNTREQMMLSQLHGNLILLFYDYLTEKPFISFIGKHELTDTVRKLIAYSELHCHESKLKLIPEEVAMNVCSSEFDIIADEDSHDYIIPVSYLSSLVTIPSSNNLAASLCRKFISRYPNHIVKNCLATEATKDEHIDLFKRWAKIRNLDHWELNEYCAFEKFIGNKENDNHIVSLYDGNRIIGFAAYEILPQNYAVCHFAKADKDYKGIYDGLYFEMGKILQTCNVRYLNFEQDLGIPGLRQSKRKYKPEFYLKKFIIKKTECI